MSQFYNPFNFVPLNDNPNTSHDVAYETIASGESHITHQLWQPNALSGAIFLSITNHSDLIVGGEREEQENKEKTVKFFKSHVNGRLDKPNQLAIPANSLRGTIASVAETISDSAMRVLADEKYSVRVPTNQSMNCLGIVRKNGTTGKYYIQPISLPPVKANYRRQFTITDKHFFPNIQEVSHLSWSEYVKFSVEVYKKKGDKLIELTKENIEKHRLKDCRPHVFDQKGIELKRFQGMRNNKFFFVKKTMCDVSIDKPLESSEARDYFEVSNRGVDSITSQRVTPLSAETLLTEAEYNEKGCPAGYMRCILMCLGTKGRETEVASTKKNEYLIPYSEQKHNLLSKTLIPLPLSVIESFETIAKQTCDTKSFLKPQGWEDIDKKCANPWQIMGGDLLYFSAIKQDGQLIVDQLSHSQIWRAEVSHQSLHGILDASNKARNLPWGSAKRKASGSPLTPAEAIFGVVEDRETDKNNVDDGKALASRVRFYDAVCLQPRLEAYPYSLTLDSPKPPSPSLYLHKPNGQGVGKADAVEGPFHINGRKRYIQHNKASEGEVNTGTDSMLSHVERLYSSTTPNFGFWIEFDNLSQDELSLLLLSTGSKQSGNENPFYHQLGMGKPYGFGKSELEVLTVLLKDPQQRYLNLSDAPSYSQVLSGYEPNKAQLSLLKTLNKAIELPALSTFLSNTQMNVSSQTLHHTGNPLVNLVALVQVSALADESQFECKEIGYPMPSPSTPDSKIFDWFGHNEENKQRLDNPRNKKPVTAEYQFLGKLPKDGSVKPLTKMKKPLKK